MLKNKILRVGLIFLLAQSPLSADCIKPIFSGENLWQLTARIGTCIDDTLEQTNSKLDALACENPGCEVEISQADIPYVITEPGIYCLAESVTNTGLNSFLITVSASNVVLDLKDHGMDGGTQDGLAQGAQDGILVYPGLKNIIIRNGTLSNFAAHGINASSSVQPNTQTPIERLTIDNIQALNMSSYVPGLSNTDQLDLIGSTLDSLSAVPGFDPVLECCLGNEFQRVKEAVGIYIDGAYQVAVTNCRVFNAQGDGIYLRYVQAAVVNTCDSSNNGGNGLVFDNCDVSSVSCCKAEQNGFNGFYEVSCNGDNGYSNCTAKQNGVHGFRIIGGGKIIDSCIANQNTLDGFFVVSPENSTLDGSLDITFNGDGKVLIPMSGTDNIANAIAVQKDNKIVATGTFGTSSVSDVGLVRYTAGGQLDNSFGVGGIVSTNFGVLRNVANGVAIQEDGKIVIVGQALGSGESNFLIARYLQDGALETFTTTSFSVGGDDIAAAVAIQEDGKIVVAGQEGVVSDINFGLARYNTDLSLDSSFGVGGKVITPFGVGSIDSASAVAIQKDGKIVAAGASSSNFALVRYNTDGSLDSSFGINGQITTDFGGIDAAQAVVVQKDGSIVAVGRGNSNFALARYNTHGSLDSSFDGDGKTTTNFGGFGLAFAAALQKDGRIIAAGLGSNTDALARYLTNGALDSSFGVGGKEKGTLSPTSAQLSALALQRDGKLVGGGTVGFTSFAAARYNIFKRPSTIYNSVAQENGRHGFNITQAAKITMFNNVASNNACNGFVGPEASASAFDTITKNVGDNNNCADYSNIDSVLLSPSAGAWKNIRLS